VPQIPWTPPVFGDNEARPSFLSFHQLARSQWWIPPWQRGVVWTGDQQRAFCQTVWDGFPLAPILLWEQQCRFPGSQGKEDPGATAVVVLDGQQRLTALGMDLVRWDGTPHPLPESVLQLERGIWAAAPETEGDRTLLDLFRYNAGIFRGQRIADERIEDLLWQAQKRLQFTHVPIIVLGPYVPLAAVQALFQAWNIPGTPLDPAEATRLVAEAQLHAAAWQAPLAEE
jgi:hypothetical protein